MKIALIMILCSVLCAAGQEARDSATERADRAGTATKSIENSEFIFEQAPFRSCHASTICETKEGLVAAWFGGTGEGKADVGIWLAGRKEGKWSSPVQVATGVQSDGKRYPCWNPVLFQAAEGPLLLFYKVGPSPSKWWGMLKRSQDGGLNWSEPGRLPTGFLGPIKNKPVLMGDGTLLCPSSTEDEGWRVHLERTADLGQTWTKTAALNERGKFGAIQPSILLHSGNQVQILCRSRQQRITQCWSSDGGQSWSQMEATQLPNPNSGIDAVTLRDGRHLLVYNPSTRERSPLSVAQSADGRNWVPLVTLEDQPGEYSYPAVIQSKDGRVHITYTWKRQRIKHAVVRMRAP